MKIMIYTLIPFLFFSFYNIKINTDNETRVTSKPLHIDKLQYNFLKDTFKVNGFEPVNDLTGSLNPKYPMVLAFERYKYDNVLFYKGCISVNGYALIIKAEDGYHILRNRNDLKKFFAPIESKEEALSYAYISTGLFPAYKFEIGKSFRKFVSSVNTTYSIKKNGGYEVNLFDYKFCGCGPHPYFMVRYQISINGDIEKIETIKLYEDPLQDGLCVD
jgi:hypothetical protein